MAAYDNVSLPGAPDIARAGNYADMLMKGLSNLGESYQKGKNFQYQQRQQNLFQDPDSQAMLQDALKTGNYAPLLQKMIQSGGAPSAASLLPQLMGQKSDQDLADAIRGGGGTPQQPNTSPTGQTAAALDKASTRAGGGQPSLSATGSDSAGAETVRSLTAGIANGRPVQDTAMTNYARAIGVSDPDAPLSAEQEARARKIIGNNLIGAGRMAVLPGGDFSQSPPPATNDAASGGAPPINAASANQGNEPPAVGGGGGQAISPAPTAAAGGIQPSGPQVAQAPFGDRFGAAYGNPPGGVRPSPLGDQAKADRLRKEGNEILARGAQAARFSPKAFEAAEKAAAPKFEQAKQIEDSIKLYNEPGRTQRDVESGATLKAEQIKTDTERFGKQYDAIQHQADETNKLVDTLKLTKGLMDQPSFYSGAGAEFALSAKRIGVALGLTNPSEAQAMEAFGKTVSSAVMDQIRSLGGQGLGQVRVAEIKIMERAAQNHDNTPASNRLLTELQTRMAENWTLPIAKLAREYNNGHLDAGFDKIKQDWINKHPLLSKEELDDPRRIAPPLARTPADLDKIGWKPGMPFRTPDGRVLTHAPQPPGG